MPFFRCEKRIIREKWFYEVRAMHCIAVPHKAIFRGGWGGGGKRSPTGGSHINDRTEIGTIRVANLCCFICMKIPPSPISSHHGLGNRIYLVYLNCTDFIILLRIVFISISLPTSLYYTYALCAQSFQWAMTVIKIVLNCQRHVFVLLPYMALLVRAVLKVQVAKIKIEYSVWYFTT